MMTGQGARGSKPTLRLNRRDFIAFSVGAASVASIGHLFHRENVPSEPVQHIGIIGQAPPSFVQRGDGVLRFPATKGLAQKIFERLRLEPVHRVSTSPLLPFGEPGAWDEGGLRSFIPTINEDGTLAVVGDNRIGLYCGTKADGTTRQIGLAISSDGNVWNKSPSNPVFVQSKVAGTFDESGIENGNSIKMKDGTIRLYYTGMGEGGLNLLGMGMATSTDGVRWSRHGATPMIDNSFFKLSGGVFGMVFVLKTSFGWRMVCEGYSAGFGSSGYAIFGAKSEDGITWTALNSGYPILGANPNGWTKGGVANPKLMEIEPGKVIMTYNAQSKANFWRGTAAITADPEFLSWEPYMGGAILGAGDANAWDDHRIEDLFIVKDDVILGADSVRMFYFGTNDKLGVVGAQIGMARIPQAEERFDFWLPSDGPAWAVEKAPAPWGSDEPVLKITDNGGMDYGHACSRPFELGGGVSVRFAFWIESIPSEGMREARGFRFSLRDGPDSQRQAGPDYPSLVVQRSEENPGIIVAKYWDGYENSFKYGSQSLPALEEGRAYFAEIRLNSRLGVYDIYLQNSLMARDIRLNSGDSKHVFVIDGFPAPNGRIYVGNVAIGPL